MLDTIKNEYSLLINYFLPSVKLINKERIGSTIIKEHDKPMTPCQRLLASAHIAKKIKAKLFPIPIIVSYGQLPSDSCGADHFF